MLNLISCVLSFSSWNYNRYGYMGVLCLQHHPPPPLKSSGVNREKRRRLFPLHRLCLICNQLISSASIPSGQLTNTVLLSWKDWQTHTHTPYHAGSIVLLSKFPIVIHKLPGRTSIFQVASAAIICLQWFDILPYESTTGDVSASDIRLSHILQKQTKGRANWRKVMSNSCFYHGPETVGSGEYGG